MKFGQLKIGAAFEFEGEIYIKTSPMIGRCQGNGTQKFFRRAMEVVWRDEAPQTKPSKPGRRLTQAEIAEAFDDFYHHCQQCLEDLTGQLDTSLLQSLRGQLENARRDFLARLN